MKYLAVLLAAAALVTGGAYAQDGASVRAGTTAARLEPGRDVYARWCAPCHAAYPRLAGTMSLQAKYSCSLPAALEDRTDLNAALIAYFVRNGVAWMPPFRPTEISDAELAQLTEYLTAPLAERGAHAPLMAQELVGQHGETQ